MKWSNLNLKLTTSFWAAHFQKYGHLLSKNKPFSSGPSILSRINSLWGWSRNSNLNFKSSRDHQIMWLWRRRTSGFKYIIISRWYYFWKIAWAKSALQNFIYFLELSRNHSIKFYHRETQLLNILLNSATIMWQPIRILCLSG